MSHNPIQSSVTHEMSNTVNDRDNRPVEDRLLEGLEAYLNPPTATLCAGADQVQIRGGSPFMSPSHHSGHLATLNRTSASAKTKKSSVKAKKASAKKTKASAKVTKALAEIDLPNAVSKHRGHWFLDAPPHDYILPAGGPINATMVEIITLFPLWFRNSDIAERFQNNNLSTAIHFEIFQEHHDLGNPTLSAALGARDYISDLYRKAMRHIDPNWSKSKQRTPAGWNATSIQINSFLPDIARQPHYHPLPGVPFRNLAVGLKKLPTGDDAADLTRALLFTIQNQRVDEDGHSVDYLFPDDLQRILDHIGRTVLTQEHSDPAIVARYYGKRVENALAKEETTKNGTPQARTGSQQLAIPQPYLQQSQQMPPPTPIQSRLAEISAALRDESMELMDLPIMSRDQPMSMLFADPFHLQSENSSMFDHGQHVAPCFEPQPPYSTNEGAAAAAAIEQIVSDRADNLVVLHEQHSLPDFPDIPECCRLRDLEIVPGASQSTLQTEGIIGADFTFDDLDALMVSNHSIDLWNFVNHSDTSEYPGTQSFNADANLTVSPPYFSHKYLLTDILRKCVEADDGSDQSPLARASRWARLPQNANSDWPVAEVNFIVDYLATDPVRNVGDQL